jgi:putative glutamine amidotransferase
MPHSTDREYSERAIPQYERAVALAGGEPVRIPLDADFARVKALVESCFGVLLPGSKADVDPTRFRQPKLPHTANADLKREAMDDFLLEDAYSNGKPVLGICYGLQSLNVFRRGSLIQHIPDFLSDETRARVDHEAGKNVAAAHSVAVDRGSQLFAIATSHNSTHEIGSPFVVPVNSSHHQSADTAGDGLRIVGRCAEDSIIEALEGTSPDHFVLAVQWHPERSIEDPVSQNIFRALVEAASRRRQRSHNPGDVQIWI